MNGEAVINVDIEGNGFVNPLSMMEDKDIQEMGDSRVQDVTSPVKFDHIDVSLVEDSAEPEEVLTNATDFFCEHNDNYEVTWSVASQRICELEDDPSRPPIPGWNLEYIRFRLRRIIESFYFRIFTMALILIDVIIVIIDLTTNDPNDPYVSGLQIADLVITVYFVIEIILRILALNVPVFFSAWYNVVDFIVVLCTFIIVVVAIIPNSTWADNLTLLTILRFVRIFRFIRLYTEKKQMETAARQLISQNKRRYQQDGYDLDLTYVTARIIATSFPSSGFLALYRNPIEKVAAFLDAKHRNRYKLYNLCSERTYDAKFFHNRVERYLIDDHNVPSCEDMSRFAKSVKNWLNEDPDNVIVVHCKGGKGRTGTMICVWMVESGIFSTANQSLEYFGQRRTDTNVGNKFQGVETPSQSRYVGYYEVMKNKLEGLLPPPRSLLLKKMVLKGMMYVGKGDGSDFWFSISEGKNKVFSGHLGYKRNCDVRYDSQQDILAVDVINCPTLNGDIRVLFQTSSKSVPKGYEDCPFYLWFNSYFIDSDTMRLSLKREELDNPHKAKTWYCFRPTFQIDLLFEEVQT